jgi:hypothetical protein
MKCFFKALPIIFTVCKRELVRQRGGKNAGGVLIGKQSDLVNKTIVIALSQSGMIFELIIKFDMVNLVEIFSPALITQEIFSTPFLHLNRNFDYQR